MSYGFEVLNSNGILIANSTDFNFGLVTAGSVTTAAGGNTITNVPTTTITFSNTGEIPLVFVRNNATNWITLWNLGTTFASFVGWTDSLSGVGNRRSTAAVTVDFRIYTPFRNLGNVSGQDYGIQIFDANSAKTFDSNYAFPRIVNTGSITIPNTGDAATSSPVAAVAFSSGVNANPWYSISHFGRGQVGTHRNDGYFNFAEKSANTYYCTKTNTTQFLLSFGQLGNNTGAGGTSNWQAAVSYPFFYLNV